MDEQDFVLSCVASFLPAPTLVACERVSWEWRREMCRELFARARACREVPLEFFGLESDRAVDVRNGLWQHVLLRAAAKAVVVDEFLRVDVDAVTAAVGEHLRAAALHRQAVRACGKQRRIIQHTRIVHRQSPEDGDALARLLHDQEERLTHTEQESRAHLETHRRALAFVQAVCEQLLQGMRVCQTIIEDVQPGSGGAEITKEEVQATCVLLEELERASSGARVGVQQSLTSIVRDLTNPFRPARSIKHSILRVITLTRFKCAKFLHAFPCNAHDGDGDDALWDRFDELRRLNPSKSLLRLDHHFAVRPCFTIHICDTQHRVQEWWIRDAHHRPIVLTRASQDIPYELNMAILDLCSFSVTEPGFLLCVAEGYIHQEDWRSGVHSFTQRSTRRVMQKLSLIAPNKTN